jgi:hypothetical protein
MRDAISHRRMARRTADAVAVARTAPWRSMTGAVMATAAMMAAILSAPALPAMKEAWVYGVPLAGLGLAGLMLRRGRAG